MAKRPKARRWQAWLIGICGFGSVTGWALPANAATEPPESAPATQRAEEEPRPRAAMEVSFPPDDTIDPALRRAVKGHVRKLAHPDYAVRQEATAAIEQGDPASVPLLVQAYRQETDYETKLRLRHLIEHLFFKQLMRGEEGFIGIRLFAIDGVYDPRVGRPVEAVYVQEVLPGLPAEQAGLQDRDILVGFQGKPMAWFFGAAGGAAPGAPGGLPVVPRRRGARGDGRVERFTRHVKRLPPGSDVVLRILRSSAEPREVSVPIRAEPAASLDGATLVTVPASMLGTSPLGAGRTKGGLLVTQTVPDSPADQAGLEPGVAIVAAGRAPVPVGAAADWLDKVVSGAEPGAQLPLDVVQIRDLQVTVTLGRRPVQLMNPRDLAEARSRFAAWWHDQSGEFATERRSGASPRGRTTPQRLEAGPEPAVEP